MSSFSSISANVTFSSSSSSFSSISSISSISGNMTATLTCPFLFMPSKSIPSTCITYASYYSLSHTIMQIIWSIITITCWIIAIIQSYRIGVVAAFIRRIKYALYGGNGESIYLDWTIQKHIHLMCTISFTVWTVRMCDPLGWSRILPWSAAIILGDMSTHVTLSMVTSTAFSFVRLMFKTSGRRSSSHLRGVNIRENIIHLLLFLNVTIIAPQQATRSPTYLYKTVKYVILISIILFIICWGLLSCYSLVRALHASILTMRESQPRGRTPLQLSDVEQPPQRVTRSSTSSVSPAPVSGPGQTSTISTSTSTTGTSTAADASLHAIYSMVRLFTILSLLGLACAIYMMITFVTIITKKHDYFDPAHVPPTPTSIFDSTLLLELIGFGVAIWCLKSFRKIPKSDTTHRDSTAMGSIVKSGKQDSTQATRPSAAQRIKPTPIRVQANTLDVKVESPKGFVDIQGQGSAYVRHTSIPTLSTGDDGEMETRGDIDLTSTAVVTPVEEVTDISTAR